MSIKESSEEIKGGEEAFLEEEFDLVPKGGHFDSKTKLIYVAILVLVATASFGLGRISFYKNNRVPVEIKNISQEAAVSQSVVTEQKAEIIGTAQTQSDGEVVASKNSNKYHYPWCAGAKQISEQNKITFTSIEEARKAGYLPAGNCKGLK